MSYRFVPVDAPSVRQPRRNRGIMAKLIIFLTVIVFLAFILHGGIFLIVPVMLVYKLFKPRRTRRVNRNVQQREFNRAFDPNAPYSNL